MASDSNSSAELYGDDFRYKYIELEQSFSPIASDVPVSHPIYRIEFSHTFYPEQLRLFFIRTSTRSSRGKWSVKPNSK